MTIGIAAVSGTAVLERELVEPALPVRRVSRISTEMHLCGDTLLQRALPHPFDRNIVLLVVVRVCAPDWTHADGFRAPAAVTRSVSISSIANSLGRPFETVRRHVHALVGAGACVAGPGGIALDPQPAFPFDPVALMAGYSDLIVRFAEDVGHFGLLPPPARRAVPALRLHLLQTALDIALMPFEKLGMLFGDWAAFRVWGCMGALNVRHVMLDPELDERYAVASTPDAVRRPVPLRTISRTLGMPYATAWRHAQALRVRGVASETADGWVVRQSQLREDRMEAQVVEAVLYYLRRLGALARAGLDPASPDHGYAVGRPPLVPER